MKKSIKLFVAVGTLSLLITGCNVNIVNTTSSEEPKPVTYTITWKNYDGKVLEVDDEVLENSVPTYDGLKPTKESDAQFSYVWTGWTPEVTKATANAEYVATYKSETNKYTVTWKNDNGDVLKTEDLLYGTTPEYSGETPTKADTVEHTYTFEKWSPEIAPITQNTTYVASFKEEARKYSVTWKDEDGTVLKTDEVPYGTVPTYGEDVPVKESTEQFSYVFANWSPNVTSVTGDIEYSATYNSEIRKYTVTWKNSDGTVLEVDDNVLYGTVPTFDSGTPTRTDNRGAVEYTFANWSPEIKAVTGDQTYVAEYSAVGTFSFKPINYEMENGYKLSDINGAPWINSNIVGEINKIKKPSLKDDFYASVNFEKLRNWENGAFGKARDTAENLINQVFIGDTSTTTNGAILKAACNYIYDGSADQIAEYFADFDIVSYLSSKNVFATNSSLFTITTTDFGYEVGFNDGYLNQSYTTLPIAWVWDNTSEAAKNVLKLLSSYMNLDFTDDDLSKVRDKEYKIFYDSYTDSYGYGEATTSYTVNSIPWAPLKSALLDFGLTSNTTITLKKYYRSALNTIFNNIYPSASGKDLLKKMVTSRLAFDFRFLIGGEQYKEVCRYMGGLGYYFEDEVSFQYYDKISLAKELIKKGFKAIFEQTYIELGSSDETKIDVSELIDAVLSTYMELADTSWLGDVTKQKMKTKLALMDYISCYCDYFKNYAKVDKGGIAYQSAFDIYKLYLDAGIATRLNYSYEESTSFDSYSSSTVNAFYSPATNSFVILNGLASSFIGGSVEEKYGLLATVIGHEITHAFDSSGSQYDENGNPTNWWTNDDKKAFNTKVNKLKSFYNQISLKKNFNADGEHVNGEATADLGGMKVALLLAKKVENFDYDKFFRSYAYIWLTTPIYSYQVAERAQDTHPFNYLRANVVLSQFDEFVETYDIKPGDGMYVPEEQRIKVW